MLAAQFTVLAAVTPLPVPNGGKWYHNRACTKLKVLTIGIQSDAIISFQIWPSNSSRCRVVSMLTLAKNLDKGGLPLWNAFFCLDCELISNSGRDECPVCNGRSLVSLARILGCSLFAHREHESLACGKGLFDITITVELQQTQAKDLTTALERLTSVIGPQLARDQATFHINVKPSAEALKLQGSLCFPERDAA